MASPGENENNSNENNTNKPVTNIFGSSTKSSISNLFAAQENTSDSFSDPSSSHINLGESSQGGSLLDSKPVEGDSSGEQFPGLRVSENSKLTHAPLNYQAPERSPSVRGENKVGIFLLTLSERINPSLYDQVVETAPSNTLTADAERNAEDSQKPADVLAESAGLFSDTPRDESLHALDATQVTEPVPKEHDATVTSDASLTQGQEHTQKDQLTGLDNDLLTSKFGTSGLLPPQTFSSAKTFDLIENEQTIKMTEPSVSSNAVSLTESINEQGPIFGDANKPGEFETEGLTSSKETTSVFGLGSTTEKQTSLFGSTSPSTLFGNQEASVHSAQNDTGDSHTRFGRTVEVKSEQTTNDDPTAQGTSGGTSNLFGSAASSATSLFGSSSTSIFGSAPGASGASTGSVFAASDAGAKSGLFGSTETPAKGSLFGNIDTSSATSVFGQPSAATGAGTSDATTTTTVPTVAADNSGTAAAAVLSSSTNLFGTADKTEASTASNLFGTTGTTGTGTSGTSLFGSSTSGLTASGTTSSSNLFASSSTATAPTTNLFGAPSVGSDAPAASTSLFGATDKTASTTTSNLFGTTATANDTSATTSNLFGSTDKTTTSNLFGTTETAASSTNLFGTTDKTTTSNLFGTADTSSSNLYGQPSATSATASAPSVNATATAATGTSSLFGTTGTSSASSLFGTTDSASSTNLFGKTDTTSSSNLFGTKDAATTTTTSNLFGSTDKTTSNLFATTDTSATKSSNLFGSTDTTTTSNLFGSTDKTTTSNLFGTTETAASATTSNLFGTTATANDSSATTSNLFGTTTTTTMDRPSTSDLFKTTQAPGSTTGTSAFGGLGGSATDAANKLTSLTGLLSNDKTESLLDSTKSEQSKPRVTFNLPSEDANQDAAKKTDLFQQVEGQASVAAFSQPEQLTIGNLLDNWEKNISEKVRTFNSFADRVATIDQQIVLQCNNINGLLNMHKELLEKHKKMESLMKVIEEEQKMALSVLDKMEKVLSGKLESLNRRSTNYSVTQAITRNLQELTDQLASTTKATENMAQVCQPEPIFTIAKILSFHQISLIDLEKQCDEIDSRIRSMQRRV